MNKKIKDARRVLICAMDECERTRAEAQWCHGYRTKGGDTAEMRFKEQAWWKQYAAAVKVRDRALRRYVRLRIAAAQQARTDSNAQARGGTE